MIFPVLLNYENNNCDFCLSAGVIIKVDSFGSRLIDPGEKCDVIGFSKEGQVKIEVEGGTIGGTVLYAPCPHSLLTNEHAPPPLHASVDCTTTLPLIYKIDFNSTLPN
ncbi:hypothetical protein J6590_083312 [Homalodisca vitripennis]|nr:hypothetical protein J6590_083312 [Homalodisca vitripennis]